MNITLSTAVKCSECPIRHRAVCARCDTDEMVQLELMKSYRTFQAGDQILWRGEEMTFVGSVVHGVASLSKTLEDGRTQTVGLMLPSDFMGRPGRREIAFDVIATTDVTLCCFDKKPFENLILETPHIAERLMEMTLDELDSARDWMVLLGRKTAREKIATFLEMLLRRSQHPDPTQGAVVVDLPMTRDQIANYTGLTLETVSRQMTALKNAGVITFTDRRHFKVTDPAALHRATGDDTKPKP